MENNETFSRAKQALNTIEVGQFRRKYGNVYEGRTD